MIENLIESIYESTGDQMVAKLIRKIHSRLKLPRGSMVVLSHDLIQEINKDKFDYYFSGTVTASDQTYSVKCFKYSKTSSIELITIEKVR